MIDIAILRAMVAAGTTPEAMLAVIEADRKVDKDALAKRRANDAERQRRRRIRHVTSRDPSRDPSVTPPHALTTPPKEENSEPKKVLRSLGTHIPENWIAAPAEVEFARQEGLTDNQIADQEARFRDYWKARPGAGGRKRDWPATWRNWIRNNRSKGNPNGSFPDRRSTAERNADAFAQVRRELRDAASRKNDGGLASCFDYPRTDQANSGGVTTIPSRNFRVYHGPKDKPPDEKAK